MTTVSARTAARKIDPERYLSAVEDKKSVDWLEAQLAKVKKDGPSPQMVQLTPELARVLLARNPANRTISETIVSRYTRDMQNDAWLFNGEPLIISSDGSLNDGQHRCMAVILSGKTIPVAIVIGVERETRTTLDQGRMRSAGDYLTMNGHTDATNLAAAAKMVWQWQHFGMVSGSPQHAPTKGEIMLLIERTPKIATSLKAVKWLNISTAGSRALLGFCMFAFSLTSAKGDPEMFIHGLTVGDNLPSDSPILYARNRLLSEKGRLRVGERAELIFRAWNAWRRDEHPKSIPLSGGELPLLES